METRAVLFFPWQIWSEEWTWSTMRGQEPRQPEKRECLAVAEARTARSLQQQHRLWPASKPINSCAASRTTSRQTRRAALPGDTAITCVSDGKLWPNEKKRKRGKKKGAEIQQSLVVYKKELQMQVKNWLHFYTVVEGNPSVLATWAQARDSVLTLKS